MWTMANSFLFFSLRWGPTLIAHTLSVGWIVSFWRDKETLPALLIFVVNKYLLFSIYNRHDSALSPTSDFGSRGQSIMELKGACDSVLSLLDPRSHLLRIYGCVNHTYYSFSSRKKNILDFLVINTLPEWCKQFNLTFLHVFWQHTQSLYYLIHSNFRWTEYGKPEQRVLNGYLEGTNIFLQIQLRGRYFIHPPPHCELSTIV